MPEIIFQSSRLSSTFPKKNPTAHSSVCFVDAGKWGDRKLQELINLSPILLREGFCYQLSAFLPVLGDIE